jgi:DinB superfamily
MSTQSALVREFAAEYREHHDRVAELVRPLDPERLLRRPAPGKWSVGEVLEHLTLMDTLFLEAVQPLLRTARADAGAAAREWKPTFVGKLIAGSLQRPRPLKSARAGLPVKPRGGVAEAFLAGDMRFAQMLSETSGLDWNAVRVRPPVVPWFPLKMNLGDVFNVHRVHVARHQQQIERTIVAV